VRTKRGEIHQAGEGNNPVIHGIDNVATIELEQSHIKHLPTEFNEEKKSPKGHRLAIGSTER